MGKKFPGVRIEVKPGGREMIGFFNGRVAALWWLSPDVEACLTPELKRHVLGHSAEYLRWMTLFNGNSQELSEEDRDVVAIWADWWDGVKTHNRRRVEKSWVALKAYYQGDAELLHEACWSGSTLS